MIYYIYAYVYETKNKNHYIFYFVNILLGDRTRTMP